MRDLDNLRHAAAFDSMTCKSSTLTNAMLASHVACQWQCQSTMLTTSCRCTSVKTGAGIDPVRAPPLQLVQYFMPSALSVI